MKLKNKVVFVTGAGHGIGRAIAKLFVTEGANVIGVDIKTEGLLTLVDEVTEAGGKIGTFKCDVSNREDVDASLDLVLKTYGKIDIVVNNAGIMDEFMPVGELTDERWRKVLGVNLDGPMFVSRKALEYMVPKGQGVIINMSSTSGMFGGRAGAAYTVSKHALIGLTRSITSHYGNKGIRCNALCPGNIDTGIDIGNPSPLAIEKLKTLMPSLPKRVGTADDVAKMALFLASDDSPYVNGAVLTLDGGWTCA